MSAASLSDLSEFEDYCWRDVMPPALLAIYAPYRRERRIPNRPALLIMHPAPNVLLTEQPDWSTAASRLAVQARAAGLPVIHSLPPGGRTVTELAPKEGEPTIVRPYDSAFMSSDLAPTLIRMRAAGLILCGVTTSGALRATAVEAKSYAFKVAVAQEATADEASILHKVALFDIAHKYADVMSLEEMLGLMQCGPEALR